MMMIQTMIMQMMPVVVAFLALLLSWREEDVRACTSPR